MTDLRSGLSLGAAAMVTLLVTHAAIDFDWDYLVLASLFTIGLALTHGGIRGESWVHSGVKTAPAELNA